MSYRELYAHCQTLAAHISRRDLILKASELKGEGRVQIFETGIDTALFRGMFFVPNCENHWSRLAKGKPCILVARDMDRPWKRFVTIKELMHLFDQPLEQVGTEDDFSGLLEGMFSPASTDEPSSAVLSESLAFFMALGCICPEVRRQDYVRRVTIGALTVAAVAQELQIPEAYVHLLLRTDFKRIIEFCLERDG